MSDPYLIPGTRTLVNNFAVDDPGVLRVLERGYTQARLHDLKAEPVRGDFDLTHLARTHGAIFQDVYPWAGQFRVIDIQKWSAPLQEYKAFAPRDVGIPWLGEELRARASVQDFSRMSREEFVEHTSKLLLDLNDVHPFREGNGRTQREFLRELGLKAGYQLDWRRVDEKELLAATIHSADIDPKSPAFRDQLAKTVVNDRRDPDLARQWNDYSAGRRTHFVLPVAGPPPAWRGSITEALDHAARSGPREMLFTTADWSETKGPVYVQSASQLVRGFEALRKHNGKSELDARVFGVRPDGTIYNGVTGIEVFVPVQPRSPTLEPRLREAVEQRRAHSDPAVPKSSPDTPDI